MLPYRDSRITKFLLIVFFLLVIAYAYYEARGFLFGPRINISSETSEVYTQMVHISGKADRISSLSMNGKEIAVTEDGAFSEPYLLADGLNRIVLDATDKYGRTTHQVLQVVYVPPLDTKIAVQASESSAATSTNAASTSPMAQ